MLNTITNRISYIYKGKNYKRNMQLKVTVAKSNNIYKDRKVKRTNKYQQLDITLFYIYTIYSYKLIELYLKSCNICALKLSCVTRNHFCKDGQ